MSDAQNKDDFVEKVRSGKIDDESLIGQLFIALSTWWYSAQMPVVGVSRKELTQIIPANKLDELLEKLKEKLVELNLELVEYKFNRQHMYCLRSSVVAPSLLNEKEQSLLGVIIHHIFYPLMIENRQKEIVSGKNLFSASENLDSDETVKIEPEQLLRDKKSGDKTRKAPHTEIDILRRKLIGKYYNNKTELDRLIAKLSDLGYIIVEKKLIFFGPRTLFEFPLESLEEIAESVAMLIK